MSLRDDLLPAVDAARKVTQDLGQRTTALTIRTRTWSGGRKDLGTPSDVDLVFPARYHIRNLSDRERAALQSSGGRYEPGGTYVKLWVTPSFPGGGYTQEQLAPDVQDGTEIIYVLSGSGLNGNYELVQLGTDRPYRYELTLVARNDSPPP